MLNMSIPWWEFVVRALAVYAFMLIVLRLTGKRQVAQLSPFDFVLLLVLSNAVQNSMNGGDNSLVGGMISAVTLVLVNLGLGYVVFKSKKAATIIEGKPEILIHNGVVFEQTMTAEKISRHDLDAAVRESGCASVENVHLAVLETNGRISVVEKK
jgi:uncharacterized membrane protein YcaP (DUF421 family)